MHDKKLIHSITPFTLLDYPDHTACILWFAGCNMKCSYCYNPEIVFGKGKYSLSEINFFLKSRKHLLDGVVLSGGECLLYPDTILLIRELKAMGYLIKIDTNGSMPNRLKQLIAEGLVDYIALDFKAPLQKTQWITQAHFYDSFLACLDVLQETQLPFEVRTTVHSNLLDDNDLKQQIQVLEQNGYSGNYYIQSFRNGVKTLAALPHSITIDYSGLSTNTIQLVMR